MIGARVKPEEEILIGGSSTMVTGEREGITIARHDRGTSPRLPRRRHEQVATATGSLTVLGKEAADLGGRNRTGKSIYPYFPVTTRMGGSFASSVISR